MCIRDRNYILTKDNKDFTFGRVNKILSIKKIDSYITSFQYFLNKKENLKSYHKYTRWVDLFYNDVWKIFNDNSTNWHVDYGDKNLSLIHI